MPRPQLDSKLLDHWVSLGIAVKDAGDGAWSWTVFGRNTITDLARSLLSDILWGTSIPPYLHKVLQDAKFHPISGIRH